MAHDPTDCVYETRRPPFEVVDLTLEHPSLLRIELEFTPVRRNSPLSSAGNQRNTSGRLSWVETVNTSAVE
jgi:hypothetical protein